MYNHTPKDYVCPFCSVLNGIKTKAVLSVPEDIFFRDDYVAALISSHQWPNNTGHALIIPTQHFENIYELPSELGVKIFSIAQKTALAMKAVYGCDGVSTRQHNEPAGNQDVWHYHQHVFPRYPGDDLYLMKRVEMAVEKRAQFARKLRDYFMMTANEQST